MNFSSRYDIYSPSNVGDQVRRATYSPLSHLVEGLRRSCCFPWYYSLQIPNFYLCLLKDGRPWCPSPALDPHRPEGSTVVSRRAAPPSSHTCGVLHWPLAQPKKWKLSCGKWCPSLLESGTQFLGRKGRLMGQFLHFYEGSYYLATELRERSGLGDRHNCKDDIRSISNRAKGNRRNHNYHEVKNPIRRGG